MKELRLNAYAKVNLGLNVLQRRSDGYHEVETVLHTVALHDEIVLRETGDGIRVTADHDIPTGADSLVYRAAALLREQLGVARPVEIEIRKRVPVAAGLGGGSADAAVTLMGLAQMWKLRLDGRELHALAARLGADVTFFLTGGAAVARGRGERVQTLPPLPTTWVVLARPRIEVLTEWAYRQIQPAAITRRPDIAQLVEAVSRRDVPAVGRLLGNVFEEVIAAHHPIVGELKAQVLRGEAYGAVMTGTGPTVFGLMANEAAARRVADQLAGRGDVDVFVTRTFAEER
ncbi:MAG: 4-(cytidine 5'-diphospho)-2-C-methyl-D-erythritol kinase [Armatimonadota bacterium]|nr:4-(cytidine 5'-diphospho)-2-C-methyl-D-erythritol kinase [Armatimonadota bacterium]MDR7423178.1 4-(cytidine 5'-diphospho)-2-C-methyl-D-erythritol kinase [Armatimonadota bacterium]MDR7453848.1 4-(cytidine 5'-diphospho)-2-C-methyl-D-erythritol kinase [Armatimonadota bacterium]MDR7456448.1 4-(cytidine 5'-diphospho)-2-C-methyl-D-erythritol kinase [Armatimonadota bacterium]MDR7496874.1 4-(cytidine 5'-diphospho)-2-C-methyl-D-erythritol kinase [Armatimonadota bacterium]